MLAGVPEAHARRFRDSFAVEMLLAAIRARVVHPSLARLRDPGKRTQLFELFED
jgi:hypothetical protein